MKEKKIILCMVLLMLILPLCSCKNKKDVQMEQLKMPKQGEEVAIITTDLGVIKIRLFPEIAPKAVENFTTLAKEGFYDGQIFYRVRKDYYIQAGDPTGEGKISESIWGEPFEDEFHPDYRHFYGALSMANKGPNTNGSNFFIVQKNSIDRDIIETMKILDEESGYTAEVIKTYEILGGVYDLDNKHTVFGQVFEGMNIVDDIANVDVDTIMGKPIEPITIEKVEIVPYEGK